MDTELARLERHGRALGLLLGLPSFLALTACGGAPPVPDPAPRDPRLTRLASAEAALHSCRAQRGEDRRFADADRYEPLVEEVRGLDVAAEHAALTYEEVTRVAEHVWDWLASLPGTEADAARDRAEDAIERMLRIRGGPEGRAARAEVLAALAALRDALGGDPPDPCDVETRELGAARAALAPP